jgi:hypothetical protein
VLDLARRLAAFVSYSFCCVHPTLRVTMAMAAGLADRVWSVEELLVLVPDPTRGRLGLEVRSPGSRQDSWLNQ